VSDSGGFAQKVEFEYVVAGFSPRSVSLNCCIHALPNAG
jgi:hypothetical protein